MAADLLSQPQPSLPSDLDDVTMDFARELDFFLYGSYTPERFPNSMQVRDEHSGLKVNDWKSWVNRPELRIEMVKHFFTLGKQAGAEWMAGQGVKLKCWIARDEYSGDESDLYIGQQKPRRVPGTAPGFGMWCDYEEFMALPTDMFPELTYSDEPIEVELIIRKK